MLICLHVNCVGLWAWYVAVDVLFIQILSGQVCFACQRERERACSTSFPEVIRSLEVCNVYSGLSSRLGPSRLQTDQVSWSSLNFECQLRSKFRVMIQDDFFEDGLSKWARFEGCACQNQTARRAEHPQDRLGSEYPWQGRGIVQLHILGHFYFLVGFLKFSMPDSRMV